MIFKQFDDRFKFLSQFGFSSPNNKKDWIKVIFPESSTLERSDSNWNADSLLVQDRLDTILEFFMQLLVLLEIYRNMLLVLR